jgi:hypothetical protein
LLQFAAFTFEAPDEPALLVAERVSSRLGSDSGAI